MSVKRGLFGLLALVLLCAVLLSGFALSTHTCADCVQGRSLCPYALTLREGMQQLIRISVAAFGIAALLLFLQTAIDPDFEKGYMPTLVGLKARMNN